MRGHSKELRYPGRSTSDGSTAGIEAATSESLEAPPGAVSEPDCGVLTDLAWLRRIADHIPPEGEAPSHPATGEQLSLTARLEQTLASLRVSIEQFEEAHRRFSASVAEHQRRNDQCAFVAPTAAPEELAARSS